MTVEHRVGDLFASGLPALAHGCNCAGVMGAGIAVEFRSRWPAMYAEYRRICLAGEYQLGGVQVWRSFLPDGSPEGESSPVIFNLATQLAPGEPAELAAIAQAVGTMTWWAGKNGVPAIGMPRIGAGLGGLEWPQVAKTIEAVAGPSDTLVVVFELPREEGKDDGLHRRRRGDRADRVRAVPGGGPGARGRPGGRARGRSGGRARGRSGVSKA